MAGASTVLLFDVDGTLITCGGAGRRAMEGAFEEVTGRADVCAFSFGGNTDRAIARQGLRNAGREPSDADIDAFLERYLARLPSEIARGDGYRVLPGVVEVLDALIDREGIAVGLGTGNVERGAREKLRPGGIEGRFAFGGFGCDHEDRGRLLEAGAARGSARLGAARDGCRVVVIGDTPRDVEAARAIGAETLIVRTGWSTLEDLRAAGPDRLVDDLLDPSALAFLRSP